MARRWPDVGQHKVHISKITKLTGILPNHLHFINRHKKVRKTQYIYNNNNNNGEFLYSAHTMLCALHTYYPWELDLLFIHVPFQLPFLELTKITWLAAISTLETSRTHCHICPTGYSYTPESSAACEGKVPCPRTQHRNNVPILRGRTLKILHQAGFETARQAVTLAKLRVLAIAPRPSAGKINLYITMRDYSCL